MMNEYHAVFKSCTNDACQFFCKSEDTSVRNPTQSWNIWVFNSCCCVIVSYEVHLIYFPVAVSWSNMVLISSQIQSILWTALLPFTNSNVSYPILFKFEYIWLKYFITCLKKPMSRNKLNDCITLQFRINAGKTIAEQRKFQRGHVDTLWLRSSDMVVFSGIETRLIKQ